MLRATPKQNPAASSETCLPLISAVREYGLVHSSHTRKLSSAHVPSHFNRAPALIADAAMPLTGDTCIFFRQRLGRKFGTVRPYVHKFLKLELLK
jgi:hypothetical protein